MVRQITNIFHAIGQLALEIELIGKVKKIELVRFLMKLCISRWLYFLVGRGLCYIGFGEMISILNAKWAYDVSG